jgi:phosphate transport system substrate-binding protein
VRFEYPSVGQSRAGLRRAAYGLLAALCMTSFGCSPSTDGVTLQGSGATFPAPLYKRWFLEYYRKDETARVNYSAIGSGAGIRQFTSGLVNFGASDAGISEKEIAKLPGNYAGVLALPMTAGCIVLAYHLPGVSEPIRLSRAAYVKIFLREISRWNDPALAEDNPGVSLPDQAITVVTRADSSGTTYAFTSHMAAVSKSLGLSWTPGVDKSVNWRGSIAAQGNDGVAALIQLTPGAVGYIELGYAHLARLPMAALQNASGQFVLPDAAGRAGGEALADAAIPQDLQIKVSDPKSPGAYPIVTYTWLLTRRQYDTPEQAEALKALLRFCMDDAQQRIAAELGYVPLPERVVRRLLSEIEQIGAGS